MNRTSQIVNNNKDVSHQRYVCFMAPIVQVRKCEVPRSHFVLLLSLIVGINKQLSRHVAQRATVARAKHTSFWQVINGKDRNYRWQKVAHLPQNYWLVLESLLAIRLQRLYHRDI